MLEYSGLRLLVFWVRRVGFDHEGVVRARPIGPPMTIRFASNTAKIVRRRGLLGWELLVDDVSIARGLGEHEASLLEGEYRARRRTYWENKLQPAFEGLQAASSLFAEILSRDNYFRKSQLVDSLPHLQRAKDALDQLQEFDALGIAIPPNTRSLHACLSSPEEWRKERNALWVNKQIASYGAFFDGLEKHPLTSPQRKACVVDEDNVLVLAGAGTGKTSTMMAKAAYLVQSGLAKPHEILMLAFAKKAQMELEERVHAVEGMEGVRVETFHSLGSKIIGAVEGARMAVTAMAQDEILRTKFIDDGVTALQTNEDFVAHLREFFCSYLVPVPNELEFKTLGEYRRYLKNQNIRSLNGEQVKSFAELEIANYLFLNGIEYVYEPPYEHPTATPSRQQYKPDFYLPRLEVYIEHFGVDRNGDTAFTIDKESYWEGIYWKRDIHKQFATALIETFSYEKAEGVLTVVLEERLKAHCAERDIDFETCRREQPFEALKELGSYKSFSKLLDGFLTVFKGSTWTLAALRDQLGSSWEDVRLRVFLRIFEVVLARYEEALRQSQTIDFNDMIKKATEYVRAGHFKSPYRYIMVDEFQDISPARAALVKRLRDQVPACALFCVGDDWQAIYRFTGSDVTLTTQFAQAFGATERVDLDKTFRFNDRISDVASRFVQANPGQLRKTIQTHAKSGRTEVVVVNDWDPSVALRQALDEVAMRTEGRKASVFLLGRYRTSKPDYLSSLQRLYPRLQISFLTAHGSKGLEADYVIILDVVEGKKGFPSMMATDPIIERILPNVESFKHAEERRLFYVVLTRARNSVWVLTRPGEESPFVDELLQGGYDVSFDGEALKALVTTTAKCPVCMEGILERRRGKKADFFGCSLYPYCDGAAAQCPQCGQAPITTDGHRHRCAHPDCGFEAETCPECGVGYLTLKEGPYGPFYGCSNFRGDAPMSCRNKKPIGKKGWEGVR